MTFKKRYTLITDKWERLMEIKIRDKPSIGELIYDEKNNVYYRIIEVLHTIDNKRKTYLVVKEENKMVIG